jgi:hypothetical protein
MTPGEIQIARRVGRIWSRAAPPAPPRIPEVYRRGS